MYVVKYTLCDIENMDKRRLFTRPVYACFWIPAGIFAYLRPIVRSTLFSGLTCVFYRLCFFARCYVLLWPRRFLAIIRAYLGDSGAN